MHKHVRHDGATLPVKGGTTTSKAVGMGAAEALAKQAPAVLHGAVEIHQHAPNPTMAAH